MSKSKFIAGLASAAIFATSLSVVPTASAVQLHSEERSGRPICVATLSDRETQVSKDFFQTLINEHLALESELRALFPGLEAQFEDVDRRQAAGESFILGYPAPLQNAIENAGFEYGEYSLFFFTNSADHVKYQNFVKNGYAVEVEIAPNWTQAQFENYPFGTAPVIAAGGNWGTSQFTYALGAAREINKYGISELEYSVPSAALRPIINPHKVRVESISEQFRESWSSYALDRAATACLQSYEAGSFPEPEPVPSTTYAPTVTVTAAPSTVTHTPEPTTVTAEPSTVVVEPAPVTTTASTETVTVTPAPVTSTAPTKTLTETPEPVTSTVVPEPVVTTAPVETIVETPAPVTSTAATETVTVTPAPVTSTKERETVTVTPAPATSTAVKPTVTVTAEPTTVTTTPTVTVSADPVEVTESKDAPAEKKSEGMGVLPIIVAILAAIGGIAGFFLSNPAVLQGLI